MVDSTVRDDHATPVERPRRGWRRLRRASASLVLSMLIIGPWPVDRSGFEGSTYQGQTLARLEAQPASGPVGPIRLGLAEVDLTPSRPLPLAGFIGQVRTPYVGVDSPCLARALTVERVADGITILTADLLLINAKLAGEVIRRAGIRPDQVYFTASHTHGGPGGWGDHPLEMLVAGAYDPAFFDDLAGRLADVVRRSRNSTVPAEMAFVQVQARGRQVNRVDPGRPTHDPLSALVFRPPGAEVGTPPLAILAIFGAHATVSHPIPPRLGGDYPAALVSELKRKTGAGMVLFASGAVGDASPARPKARSQLESSRVLGAALAGELSEAIPTAHFEAELAVDAIRLEVALPPLQLPFGSGILRFSPAATWWIAGGPAPLQALRIGPATLVGFPGDYSGHLAESLLDSTRGAVGNLVATSFDGDFRGYLVSGDTYDRRPCYETRWMSFYGPWSGEYLNDLARRMAERLATGRVGHPRMPPDFSGQACRIALSALLFGGILLGGRVTLAVVRSLDLVSKVMIVVALAAVLGELALPGLAAWSIVGLPGWARWLGVPIGCLGLLMTRWARPGRTTLAVGTALFLLSASWPVVLGLGRGWLMFGLAGASAPAPDRMPSRVADGPG